MVSVLVATAGAGQVAGSASLNAAPCRSGRPLVPGGRGGAGKYITRSLRSRPSDLHRQVAQQPGQPGQVIAGVEDHQDVRVAGLPVPGGDDPGHHLADLGGGHLGRVLWARV